MDSKGGSDPLFPTTLRFSFEGVPVHDPL
jgi:hypothetical protein